MLRLSALKFPNEYFKNEKIYVWYNKEDYPANADAEKIRMTSHYIISALRQLGSVGYIEFLAINDGQPIETVLNDAGFSPCTPIGYEQGEENIFLQKNLVATMIDCIVSFPRIEQLDYPTRFDIQKPPISIVIAKPEDRLYRTLNCLKERDVQFVLLNPPSGEYMFSSVREVLEHGQILGGEQLINLGMLEEVPDEMDWDYEVDYPGQRCLYDVHDILNRLHRSDPDNFESRRIWNY